MENRKQVFWGVLAITLLVLTHHFIVWEYLLFKHNLNWARVLAHWDSKWYDRIILNGYNGRSWAFFPLYPMIVRMLSSFDTMPPQFVGTLFSTLLFIGFSLLLAYKMSQAEQSEIVPKSLLSWFLFVYSAASFVLHSHHTESLFLLLSFLAFWFAYERNFLLASIFAGLCWLTRHQGLFVTVCVALLSVNVHYERGHYKKAALYFVGSMLISSGFFFLYPLYQYMQEGNPFLFIEAQRHWSHATSLDSIFNTFWFGNPEQIKYSFWNNSLHLLYYLFLWVLVILLWKKNKILALYGVMSLCVLLLQASFLNIYRFGVVLFPLHFILGDKLSHQNIYIKGVIIFMVIALNHHVTSNYLMGRWAY
jgi:Gpi18-like mannosyltransferase